MLTNCFMSVFKVYPIIEYTSDFCIFVSLFPTMTEPPNRVIKDTEQMSALMSL